VIERNREEKEKVICLPRIGVGRGLEGCISLIKRAVRKYIGIGWDEYTVLLPSKKTKKADYESIILIDYRSGS
jgi:hypothetical protein